MLAPTTSTVTSPVGSPAVETAVTEDDLLQRRVAPPTSDGFSGRVSTLKFLPDVAVVDAALHAVPLRLGLCGCSHSMEALCATYAVSDLRTAVVRCRVVGLGAGLHAAGIRREHEVCALGDTGARAGRSDGVSPDPPPAQAAVAIWAKTIENVLNSDAKTRRAAQLLRPLLGAWVVMVVGAVTIVALLATSVPWWARASVLGVTAAAVGGAALVGRWKQPAPIIAQVPTPSREA